MMQVAYLKSFSKDLDKIKDASVKEDLLTLINDIKSVNNFQTISNLKKLKGFKHYYRIRMGDYRLGISHENNTVTFIRFLSRKDIYKYFP